MRTASAFSRRELMLWLAAVLLAHQLLVVPGQSISDLVTMLQGHLASKSVFYYLGWYAIFRLIADSSRTQPGTGLDVAVVLFVLVANFLSARSILWMSATVAGAYLMWRGRGDLMLRSAGVVLLAVAFNGFWGPQIFDLFAYHLLRIDAALVGAVLSVTQPGTTWSETIVGTVGGHSIVVYAPCSSFHNISLGLLCWVTMTRLARPYWVRSDIWVALLVCGAVVALNASRLYLMALSAESYAIWHEGTGEQLFAWATTLTVLVISLVGALRMRRTP